MPNRTSKKTIRKADGRVTNKVMSISPRQAKRWLESNTKNRKLTQSLLQMYTRAMKDGEWRLNGSSIVFDGYPDSEKCRLLDGQHRLAAIVASGQTIKSVVVFGTDSAVFYTIDIGRRRSFADVLCILGYINRTSLAAGVRWAWRYMHGLHRTNMRAPNAPMIHNLLDTLETYPELADYARARCTRLLPPGLSMFLHWLLDKADKPAAEDFFTKLREGANLGKCNPIFRLRARLLANIENRSANLTQEYILALTFKAWNMWRQNQETQSLAWKPDSPYPDPIDL